MHAAEMRAADFRNEPPSDFQNNAEHRRRMTEAIEQVRKDLGREYDLVIGGERVKTDEKLISYNPAKKAEVVGTFSKASRDLAERAIREADKAFQSWSRTPAVHRARLLTETARVLRDRKYYYAAWMVFEVGKSWPEADADVAEAVDFCEYYSREMLRLDQPPSLVPRPGEKNYLRYIPLGVGVVIPPWNFPLAITVGMSTASVVAGNTVVLKPSSDSPVIAYKFLEALEQAGMPPGVLNFLPGSGGFRVPLGAPSAACCLSSMLLDLHVSAVPE